MQYIPPYGSTNPSAPWVNGNPATGAQGSIIDATAIYALEQEIVNCITQAGLDPSGANLTQLWQAIIGFGGTLRPGQIVTLSSELVMTSAMYRIGFNRTASVTATTVLLPPNGTLPSSGQVQEFVIEDLAGNFDQFPITLMPSAGTIGGEAEWVLNKPGQSATLGYYGSNLWSIKQS